MKKCELCNSVARIYCESDQASLCWDCDGRVHTANFIAAKHLRTLLCHGCQSPTPWTGSGSKLGPTVSVCQSCANNHRYGDDHHSRGDVEHDTEDDDDDEEEEEEDGDDSSDDNDDDGDNQVVPFSSTALAPPPVSSPSSGEESSSRMIYGEREQINFPVWVIKD